MLNLLESFLKNFLGLIKTNSELNSAVKYINDSIYSSKKQDNLLEVNPSEISALVIGIDYNNNKKLRLNGCVNDAYNIKEMLQSRFDVPHTNITLLTDDNKAVNKVPTVTNCIKGLSDLVKKANSGKTKVIFVTYAGHGTQTPDKNDKDFEKDGKDECWVFTDYRKKGLFKDDYLRRYLLDKINKDVLVIIISDSCHSGSMADLSYVYNSSNKSLNDSKTKVDNKKARIIQFSGCMDPQYSQELKLNGKVCGVLTYCITKHFNSGSTFKEIADKSNIFCREYQLSQIPLVSTNYPELLDKKI